MEQPTCLIKDVTITTLEKGKYVNEVQEVILDLLAMNVSMSKVNEVIRIVLQKLGRKSISRLPSKAVHLADVQLGRAMLEEADPSRVIGNILHGDGRTKYHRHYQHFEVTTPYCQTYSIFSLSHARDMLINSFSHLFHRA